MPQNPETKFTNRLRRDIKRQHPEVYIRKHADMFSSGVPDIEFIIPGAQCWFEIKWISSISKKRKISYRPLQRHDLQQRAALGVPCGLIVGSPVGVAWYHGRCLPTHVSIFDFWPDQPFDIDMFLHAHFELMSVQKLLLKGE